MTLPPEKVNELKQVIHSHLAQLDIHGQIKNLVSESMKNVSENRNDHLEEENNLLNMLKEQGIVDDIMSTLKFHGIKDEDKRSKDTSILKQKEGKWMADEERKCEKI